jgi:hypothetical protein
MEVLNEINYKHHKKEKVINEDKVKEELIDCQKYLMNLMILWKITPQEFIEIFNKKSDIVEARFLKEKL